MTDSEKSIFGKIIDGEIPADIVYEDEHCLAFRDIAPQAPVHILVIPRKVIRNLEELTDEDAALAGHLLVTIRNLARQLGVEKGYRIISNSGESAGQSVPHLHFHLLAGRPMEWPPG